MHSKQKNMENAAETDEFLKELLDKLIRNKSDEDTLGGLCRAVKNRDRQRMKFAADVESELDQMVKDLEEAGEFWDGPEKMPTGKHSLCAAPQRFDSMLTGLRSIIMNIRGVLKFLTKMGNEWAKCLLQLFMRPEFEAALPALAEYMEIARKYVHRDEGHDPDKSNAINTWSDFLHMKKSFAKMFAGEDGRPPQFAAEKTYSKGYYQLMQKSLNSLGDEVCYRPAFGGDVLYHRKYQTEEEEATTLALVMMRMQKVCEVYLAACKVDLFMAWDAASP
jgi:hypothetical protein